MKSPSRRFWTLWLTLSAVLAGWLGYGLSFGKLSDEPLRSQARALFLPGQTTSGHRQIELACPVCHGVALGGRESLQKACMNCHEVELKESRDSHPRSKFTDPRNAERASRLDAAYCVTCHVEHKPALTHAMGLTLPEDYCHLCHDGIGKDRPSHRGLGFDTCAGAGCHNFHDNRALYEDFLVKHGREPALGATPVLPERDFRAVVEELADYPGAAYPLMPLAAAQADGMETLASGNRPPPDELLRDWLETAHARAGVNCSACHRYGANGGQAAWVRRPAQEACAPCHAPEVQGFGSGKHGMRPVQGLSPMTPGEARLPMREQARERRLDCTNCHGAHRFDTRAAAVEACLGCHDDSHSLAYRQSPHYGLWQRESAGTAPAGSGVSCASCHLPRVDFHTPDDVKRRLVQHNQNDDLRPNEKMIRPVCMNCHGLGYSLDALADRTLIDRNFAGRSARHIPSIDMALAHEAQAEAARRESNPPTE